MAFLDNDLWINRSTGFAESGSTNIVDSGLSTTITARFSANAWDATQGGYNISEFGAFAVSSPISAQYDFSTTVQNLSFNLNHINDDGASTYDDEWTIYAYDESGTLLDAADVIVGLSGLVDETVVTNADGSVSIIANGTTANDVAVDLPGQISSLELIFGPGPAGTTSGGSGFSDFTFTISPPDYIVSGTSGDDTIDALYTGDPQGDMVDANDNLLNNNDDHIEAGAGNDSVVAGDGHDTIQAGTGNDAVFGGAGNDLIDDEFGPGTNGAGQDYFDGGTGDDTIYAGIGDDTIIGGDGADFIGGEEGDDLINAGADSDTISVWGPSGSDTIDGGESVTTGVDFDEIDASLYGNGIAVSYTGDEAGTIDAGGATSTFSNIEGFTLTDYADKFDGSSDGAGIYLNAGGGDDQIVVGSGNDEIATGTGNDTVFLTDGFGNDSIADFDMADDDSDGFTNDQINVAGLTDSDGNPVNAWDVVVSDDGSGNALLTFPKGETVVLKGVAPAQVDQASELYSIGMACFVEGTLIATPRGEIPVEQLCVGDEVTTLDHGAQPIKWIGTRFHDEADLLNHPHKAPILIETEVLGNHSPLLVSPLHGMLLGKAQGVGAECFARAKHLAEIKGPIRQARGKKTVRYHHLLLPQHEVVFANGARTESFYPGFEGLVQFGAAKLALLHELIPDLATLPTEQSYGPRARPFLLRKHVQAIVRMNRVANVNRAVL